MDPRVDDYINQQEHWQDELRLLRQIALDCELSETIKWKQPCYMHNGKNVLLLGAFKAHAFMSFLKGALIDDVHNILTKPGENTRSGRIAAFTKVTDIKKQTPALKDYIFQAIELENKGMSIPAASESVEIPDELEAVFDSDSDFKEAFLALTPGRQRGYVLNFTAPKQSKTRTTRINKYRDRILKGKGIHDCVCGHSKKMPNCDGSHKFLN
ncbi:hypothetical protein C1T31_08795 [Hanstruepera neustonica]|uniref:YdhG-like domain-containing protein n=1 Tax=Hanstruepera neustonica TaxID=1445657 RepID=A0A2K1DYH0_9FLAO|nr:YdeI/OmpD-associated family protein [Hanstruepera neustonica]PNQ73078.1 hypothetical protein C1T31_08795 [Hanstruepera neustonica]